MPKVRVADALDIDNSGLTNAEYSYALKAHFDFVIARENELPAFAVEFDGPQHESDVNTLIRDGLKQSVCEKLELPLLRIDSGYLRRVGRFALIGWLAEVWFLSEDFYAAQERGDVAPDEPFLWFAVMDYDLKQQKLLPPPYDPFVPFRSLISRWHEKGVCRELCAERLEGKDAIGYSTSVSYLTATNGDTIVGVARCKNFSFRGTSPRELAEELSVVDLAEKFQLYLDGEYSPPDFDEVQVWRARMSKWSARKE